MLVSEGEFIRDDFPVVIPFRIEFEENLIFLLGPLLSNLMRAGIDKVFFCEIEPFF